MSWIHIVILAIVQGLTELLPVSSSAHVIVTAELMHENMSTPDNALLLVLLHTGTMFAVIAYFWRQWVEEFLSSWAKFWSFFKLVFVASLLSGLVALPAIWLVDRILSHGGHHAQIEALFHKLNWIAPALAVAGILILWAGLREARRPDSHAPALGSGHASVHVTGDNAAQSAPAAVREPEVGWRQVSLMGILQGFAIPFRGFSRSGVTISGGLLAGGKRSKVESFSFAMVVAITPLAIARELWRVHKAAHAAALPVHWAAVLRPGMLGMVCAFFAGLLALKWLSSWLESGRWYWFGVYCLAAAAVTQWLYWRGW